MCGRFTLSTEIEALIEHFEISTVTCDNIVSYNIGPTHKVLAVIEHNGRRLGQFNWGLVPSWTKDLSNLSMINARVESVEEKPSFKNALKERRCLIIADGFFEWKKEGDGKQPFYFTLPNNTPFAFAGIWESWQSLEKKYLSCALITTEASESVAKVHHRMPLVIEKEGYGAWLSKNFDKKKLQRIQKQYQMREFQSYPVSKFVNNIRNNSQKCIEKQNFRQDYFWV